MSTPPPGKLTLRERLHEIIFESETPAGKFFDVCLLVAIVVSLAAVTVESIAPVRSRHGDALRAVEWFFTVLFSVEYALRLLAVRSPLRYAFSFFGLVDLLSVLPSYLSLVVPEAQSLLVIRSLRLLRVFRVLKLAQFLTEAAEIEVRPMKRTLSADRAVPAVTGTLAASLLLSAVGTSSTTTDQFLSPFALEALSSAAVICVSVRPRPTLGQALAVVAAALLGTDGLLYALGALRRFSDEPSDAFSAFFPLWLFGGPFLFSGVVCKTIFCEQVKGEAIARVAFATFLALPIAFSSPPTSTWLRPLHVAAWQTFFLWALHREIRAAGADGKKTRPNSELQTDDRRLP